MADVSPLAGRRVLVTGASSGIGAATVRLLAEAGTSVAALARRKDRLDELAAETGAAPVVADLAVPDDIPAAVDEMVGALGGLDALVNAAGVYLLGSFSDGEPDDWRRMFEVNVLALLELTQEALPHLTASRGHVVNVSSLAGHRIARTTSAVYAATKHAVQAISEGMRQEFLERHVRVTVVSPGVTDTELGVGTRDSELLSGIRQAQDERGIPPEAVARQIRHVLEQPHDVLIKEILVMPTVQRH